MHAPRATTLDRFADVVALLYKGKRRQTRELKALAGIADQHTILRYLRTLEAEGLVRCTGIRNVPGGVWWEWIRDEVRHDVPEAGGELGNPRGPE
jgi:DNA-binding HxlR family transcriptional regulator